MKKSTANHKIRLVLRGQAIRELRDLAEQELAQANGAVACDAGATSIPVANNCTPPR